jgi:broad specificity phosphatase PhoE
MAPVSDLFTSSAQLANLAHMRAIVVRHYKTLLNASGRILGWGDAPRAKDWGDDIAYVYGRLRELEISFDRVYSSNLERARRTAMHYARSYGIQFVHDAPELNEVNYGALYKKSKRWVTRNIPQHKKDPDFVYPEGESFRQMQLRSVDFLLSQNALYPDSTVLLVVHAGVIRGFISHFLGLDYARHLKQKVSHRYIGDFTLDRDGSCTRYDELGKKSGFVRSGTLLVPWTVTTTDDAPPVTPVTASGVKIRPAHTTDNSLPLPSHTLRKPV